MATFYRCDRCKKEFERHYHLQTITITDTYSSSGGHRLFSTEPGRTPSDICGNCMYEMEQAFKQGAK